MMTKQTIRRRHGFTLTELLVVIIIIGILLSLLFPAINAVKSRGERTKCASNLRQIGGAINLYCSEKGHWPLAYLDRSQFSAEQLEDLGPGDAWYHFIHPYLGGDQRIDYDSDEKRQADVINCPAARALSAQRLQSSYSCHECIMAHPTPSSDITLSGVGIYPPIKRPAEVILMMDGVPVPLPAGQYGALATFSGVPMIDDCRSGNPSERNDPVADDTSEFMSHMTPGASANAGWPSWRHSQTSINSLRVDGHVENMPLENEDTGLCNLLQRNIMLNY